MSGVPTQQKWHPLKRILLVDDQAHVLRVIKLSLDRNGFEVDTALSAEIALEMLQQGALEVNPYDVVITDMDMPVMDGQQLADCINRNFETDAPLIFLVGEDSDQQLAEWAEKQASTEIVEKPMSLRWLVSRLNGYFGHYDTATAG